MSKLTLSVDDDVVRRAKQYAAKRGTSVSQLVEGFLALLTTRRAPKRRGPSRTPVLDRLRGSLKGVDPAAYGRYLEGKYR